MANPPRLLSDNVLDSAVLHPSHVVSTTGTEVSGSELFRLWDHLRDLTHFTVSEQNASISVRVDMGSAKVIDTVIVDRGHNLAGKVVAIETSTNGSTWTDAFTATIPASAGGAGSDANGCLTPDGVWWHTVTPQTTRYVGFRIAAMGAGLSPLLSSLYLGQSYPLPAYLDTPIAADYRTNVRVGKNALSWGGVRAKRRITCHDEIDFAVKLEDTDWPAFLPHLNRLFRNNTPWWLCVDDADAAGSALMRLFQLPGDGVLDPVVNPVHREVRFLLEEVIPTLTF